MVPCRPIGEWIWPRYCINGSFSSVAFFHTATSGASVPKSGLHLPMQAHGFKVWIAAVIATISSLEERPCERIEYLMGQGIEQKLRIYPHILSSDAQLGAEKWVFVQFVIV
jgi:hypothetical protein